MKLLLFAFIVYAGSITGCSTLSKSKDIPNLRSVDVSLNIWRGGQPTTNGWNQLWALGITNVLKLNTEQEGSDAYAESLGMHVYRFPISTMEQLGIEAISQTLVSSSVNFMSKGGCFVHCGSDARSSSDWSAAANTQGGQDRTGAICYCYDLKKWRSKSQAKKTRDALGFHGTVLWGLDELCNNFHNE